VNRRSSARQAVNPPPYEYRMGPSPPTGPRFTMPLFVDSDTEDASNDDFGPPGLLLAHAQVERCPAPTVLPTNVLPPNILHRLAWRNVNPADVLCDLQGNTLHEPVSDVDVANIDRGDATSQTVSMVTPPGGISHVVAAEVQTSTDRRSATARGPTARGMSLAPESGSLALVWLEGGEAHCELSATSEVDGAGEEPEAPALAPEPRRSTRTRAPPAVALTSSAAAVVPRTSTRTARMSNGRRAPPKWSLALKAATVEEVEDARLERLSDTCLSACAKVVAAEACHWGCGVVKLIDQFCTFSSAGFADGPLPASEHRPQQMSGFISKRWSLIPSVVATCDNSFGAGMKRWWLDVQPVD
jgi:hypothetical protein